jgi:hypothetical protein
MTRTILPLTANGLADAHAERLPRERLGSKWRLRKLIARATAKVSANAT